jgi:hypothetical protein
MEKHARRLEYIAVEDVKPAKRNPKRHAGADIPISMGRWGFTEPTLLDERTGRLVAGHGRLEALKNLKLVGREPPEGIRTDAKGRWLVPVVRGWSSKDDTEADAYLLASNKLTERGGWDDGELSAMLAELDGADALTGVGFSDKELQELIGDAGKEPKKGQTEADAEAPAPSDAPWVKHGDLFQLGRHRLMCGDSTKPEEVARLMDGEKASLLCTDPPYGVNFTNSKGNIAADMTYAVIPAFFGVAVDQLLPGKAVLFFGAETNYTLYAALFSRELRITPKLMFWAKPQFVLRHHDYHSQYEAIFYGWTPGGDASTRWKGDRKESDVWAVPYDTTHAKKVHITQKPVELFAKAMRNHTEPGELCFEPFSGSGSQLVAGEQNGRRVHAMEIDPSYAQVSLERWEAFTGEKAQRVEG